MPTFKTEVLHLDSNVELTKGLLYCDEMNDITFTCSSSTVTNDGLGLIGYLDFISSEQLFIVWGQTHMHTGFLEKSNFKKPGGPQCAPDLNNHLKYTKVC